MAKQKKLHRIIIHPNRYLIWACAVALIIAAVLVAYINIANILTDVEIGQNSNVSYWHTYNDTNMSLRYPAEWIMDPGQGFVSFGRKDEDLFLVYSYSPPNDPAYDSYAKLAGTREITIDGLQGIRIYEKSSSQNITFVKSNKVLYEFRGTTRYFDQIINSVKFKR